MFDILTIGTVTTDTFIKADFFKTITDPKHLAHIGFKTGKAQCFSFGSKIEIEEPLKYIGGGAHNSAVLFSRFDFKTASLFNVGNDQEGRDIVNDFKNEKVNPLTIVDKSKKSGQSVIFISNSGERTILVYRGCSGEIEKKEVPFSKLKSKWAYIAPGNISFSVLKEIFDVLKKNKTQIALAPSKDLIELGIEKLKPLLNQCRVVMLNREEASYLTGISYFNNEQIFKKIDKYINGIAVMTDGEKGALASDGQTIFQAKTFKEKEVVDKTGAGDAFGSGFVAGLMERKDFTRESIAYALKLANANATSVIEIVGASTGTLTKKDFQSQSRWKELEIKMKNINK